MLTSLSLAAGCVDAVGYLGLGQVFVANMTGNTVLLGLAIGQANVRGVLHAGTALVGFVLGVAAGRRSLSGMQNAHPGRPRSRRPSGLSSSSSSPSRVGGFSMGPNPLE
jgi:uncharacterized membrane protein YoaK (UPF0700 family)